MSEIGIPAGFEKADWYLCKSEDFCSSISDGTHDTPLPVSEGYPLYTSKNLTSSNQLDTTDYYNISPKDFDAINKRSFVGKYDILFGMIGTVGNPVIIKKSSSLFAVKNVGIFRFNGDCNRSQWFYYCLKSQFVQDQFAKYLDGSTQKFVSLNMLRSFYIQVPIDKRISWKIVRILTTIDNLIEKTEALIAKYQSIKQGLMHDLFTRGVDANGKLRPPQSEAPELYKQSELGWIPKEWEVNTIDVLAARVGSGITPTGGSEVYQNEGVIFIRSQNVTYEGLDLSDVAFIDIKTHQTMSNSAVYPFDVLLNITGASIGRCCYLPDGLGQTNTNQHVCCIRLSNPNKEDAKFLSSVLGSPLGQNQIYCLNAGGNREGLNYQQLRSFIIPWAGAKERHNIANLLMGIEAKISTETKFLTKLRLKKTALMQDLLTGKVQVTPDAVDMEPAHE